VRVKSGPLEGIEGVLVRKKNGFRLVLSVDMLQKSAAVEIDAFSVERVPRRSSQPQPSTNLSAQGRYGQSPRGRIDPLRY